MSSTHSFEICHVLCLDRPVWRHCALHRLRDALVVSQSLISIPADRLLCGIIDDKLEVAFSSPTAVSVPHEELRDVDSREKVKSGSSHMNS